MSEPTVQDANNAAVAAGGNAGETISAITFNGATYTPERFAELQNAAASMERSLMSDYTKKLETVSNEKRTVEQQKQAFLEDIEFYNSHPEVLTAQNPRAIYEPKSQGGRGLVGKIPPPSDDDDAPVSRQMASAPAFEDSPKLRALEAELEKLRGQLSNVVHTTDQSEINRVSREMQELITSKYSYAIPNQVGIALTNFFNANGRHPNRAEVERIVKENHEDVGKVVTSRTKGTAQTGAPTGQKTATPVAGGAAPAEAGKKRVSIEDPSFVSTLPTDFTAFKPK